MRRLNETLLLDWNLLAKTFPKMTAGWRAVEATPDGGVIARGRNTRGGSVKLIEERHSSP